MSHPASSMRQPMSPAWRNIAPIQMLSGVPKAASVAVAYVSGDSQLGNDFCRHSRRADVAAPLSLRRAVYSKHRSTSRTVGQRVLTVTLDSPFEFLECTDHAIAP